MRIERLTPDIKLYRGYCDDLARILESQKRTDRLCTGCAVPCAAHHSPVCACACTPDCAHALVYMSSDKEKYPIEAGIAPLVQAFLRLRELHPCWSCEGHEAGVGSQARPPRIVFYARSALYPELVAEAVLTLLMQKKISCPWQVTATPFGNRLDATYTLQPSTGNDGAPKLCALRADVRVIADHLQGEVLNAARKYQAELRTVFQGAP